MYFVPAFSGLLAPHWRSDARGVILGLSSYSGKGHIVRALLEAIAWQVGLPPLLPMTQQTLRCSTLLSLHIPTQDLCLLLLSAQKHENADM